MYNHALNTRVRLNGKKGGCTRLPLRINLRGRLLSISYSMPQKYKQIIYTYWRVYHAIKTRAGRFSGKTGDFASLDYYLF